jgi:hypothetical protein
MLVGAMALVVAASLHSGAQPTPARAALCNGLPCYTLTIFLDGNGSGSWVSTDSSGAPDGNIDCRILNGVIVDSTACHHKYTDFGLGIHIGYKITASDGSSGCDLARCFTTSVTGTLTFSSDHSEYATFSLNEETLTATHIGGGIEISGDTNSIDCTANPCTAIAYYDRVVYLKAIYPDQGNVFLEWTGACAGQGTTCNLAMTSNMTTTLWYGPATYSLHVVVNGSGSVHSSPTGISCTSSGGSGCTAGFTNGTSVSLTPTGASGSTFSYWGAACVGEPVTCNLVVDADQTVSAFFVAGAATPPPQTAMPSQAPPTASAPVASARASSGVPASRAPSPAPAGSSAAAASSEPAGSSVPAGSPISVGTSPDPSTDTASPAPSQDVAAATSRPDPDESPDPATAVATSQVDLTLVLFAILGAGLLIAVGLAVAGYEIRRRSRKLEPPSEGASPPD